MCVGLCALTDMTAVFGLCPQFPLLVEGFLMVLETEFVLEQYVAFMAPKVVIVLMLGLVLDSPSNGFQHDATDRTSEEGSFTCC